MHGAKADRAGKNGGVRDALAAPTLEQHHGAGLKLATIFAVGPTGEECC